MNRSYSSRAVFLPISVLSVACVLLTPGCGGSQTEPNAPVPAETPAAPVAPAPVVAEPSAPPAAAPAEPAPPHAERRKGRRHHGISGMLLMSVHSLELEPAQKTEVAAIEADLEKLGEQHKGTGEKLGNDVSEGVAAGKIDRAKTNADIKELTKAVEATVPGIQDAVNRLHKTLDPEQRKAVVASMTAMAEKMREHAAGMGMHGAGHDKQEHGPGAGKHGPSKGAPGAAGARGPGMGEHGPMAMLTHDLALTPEQNEKIRAKLEAEIKAQKAAMQGQMTAMTKQLEAIGKAFATDAFDAKKVGVGKQAPAMAKRMAESGVKFAEIVLAVLTPEQRAKFAERVRQHASDPQ